MSYNLLTGSSYLSAMYPPGAIMSYVNPTSSADPSGWVICDGVTRTNNSDSRYNNLASLGIGSGGSGTSNYTPPNLKGAFLRGAGAASDATYTGPSVNAFQDQQMINHGHNVGNHSHNPVSNATNYYGLRITNTNTIGSVDNTAIELNLVNNYLTLTLSNTSSTNISSTSTVSGAVGGAETIPYNYGTYWILKL
jgi:hypothetical protein